MIIVMSLFIPVIFTILDILTYLWGGSSVFIPYSIHKHRVGRFVLAYLVFNLVVGAACFLVILASAPTWW